MSDLLLKLFVKNYQDTKNQKVREQYGILSGSVGIILNIILTAGKFIIGTVSNSISITADALNNLTDAGSCIVTLLGFRMAGRKPDKEHPFGHGRIEYVAALIVGFIVEIMGIELIKSSFEKIVSPEIIIFSIPAVLVLVISILGKLWLAVFNRRLGSRISSPALSAAVKDSIGDVTATSLTLFSLILSRYTDFAVDGILGIAVALFIMYSGFGILKESIGIIIGNPPSGEMVNSIISAIRSHEGVLGIHDLVIHSYGESRHFGSVHIEMSEKSSLTAAHKIADEIEIEIKDKFGIDLVAHIDPVSTDDENYEYLLAAVTDIIGDIDKLFSIHDFRIVNGTSKKLVFDVEIPFDCKISHAELKREIDERAKKQGLDYALIPTFEYSYI